MSQLLIRLFVKNADDVKNPKVRMSYGKAASVTGILVNLLVCLGELVVGFLVNSIAMMSDGIHNVADAGGSVISLISFKLSGKKADEEHPYGHGRFEYLFSIIFAAILFFVAFQLFMEAVDHIRNPEVVPFSTVAFVVMIVVMGLKIWLSTFLKFVGKRIDSPILTANGLECMSDVYATAGITVGLIVGKFFHIALDGYLGAMVALLIARAGWEVLSEAVTRLLGNEPNPDRVKEIKNFVESYPGIFGTHDLMVHDYGPGHEFASIHAEVDADTDIMKSHALIDRIEHEAREQLHLQLTIHMDPLVRDEETMAMLCRVERIVSAYNAEFKIHDFRAVESNEKTNIIFDLVIPHKFNTETERIGKSLASIIEAVDEKYHVQINVEHGFTTLA